MTYFDLIYTRSMKMSGPSRRRYCFYKGKPVEVKDKEDILKFRMHSDTFFECDASGNSIEKQEVATKAKSFSKFRSNVIASKFQEEAKKNEEVKKVTNTEDLVKAVSEDAKEIKRPIIKTKKEKKAVNVLECTLCGYVAKSKKALQDHLDRHSEED